MKLLRMMLEILFFLMVLPILLIRMEVELIELVLGIKATFEIYAGATILAYSVCCIFLCLIED